MKGEVALAKRFISSITLLWLINLVSLGAGETEVVYSVDVVIQSIPASYGDTMVAIPVFLNNEGFDTIAGYSLFITSANAELIDFVDVVDTTGSISAGFCFNSFIEVGDIVPMGDQITVVAHNLESECSGKYIYPQTLGVLLFTLYVNVADSCYLISDTNNVFIDVSPTTSNITTKNGVRIPTPGQTSAESLYYLKGYVNVPGTLNMGDINGSCKGKTPCTANLQDVIHLVNYVFDKSRPATNCLGQDLGNCWTPCPEQVADVNCTGGVISLADVIHLVNYVFDKNRPGTGCLGSDPGNCWTPAPCP